MSDPCERSSDMEVTSDDSTLEGFNGLGDPFSFQDGESALSSEPNLSPGTWLMESNLSFDDTPREPEFWGLVPILPPEFTDDLLLPQVEEAAIDGAPYSLDTGDASQSLIQDQESMDSSIDTVYVTNDCHGDHRRKRSKHVWTMEEDNRLCRIVEELGVITRKKFWPVVVKKLGCNLTVKQVREHYKRLMGAYKKNKWSEDEIAIIRRHIEGELTLEYVSSLLNRNLKQIKERIAIETKNKSEWSKEELACLEELVGVYHDNYSMIRKVMIGRGFNRTYQQIRCKVIAFLKKQ